MKTWMTNAAWGGLVVALVILALILMSLEYLWNETVGRERIEGEEEY